MRVGTVIGRYFAMDRDRRWERTQQAYDLLVHGTAPSTTPRRRATRPATAYAREETDEFITATTRRRRGAHPAGRQRHRVQLPPRPDARDHAGAGRPRLRGGRPARRRARRALHDDDRVRGGLAVPRRLPARTGRRRRSRRSSRDARAAAAARRRDREVPARDVLLRRRRGDPVRGRAARARRLSARRADLRPQAGDERARGGARRSSARGARTGSASGSSTSPTPTWWATPA